MNLDANLLANIVMGLLAMSGAWVGAYVAIRADLSRLHERANTAIDAANKAHQRIDDLVSVGGVFDRRARGDGGQ